MINMTELDKLMINMTELDKLLIQLEVVASYKNLNSKFTLNGNKCKLLNDYIKNLEILIELLYNGVVLNEEQTNLLDKVLNDKFGK